MTQPYYEFESPDSLVYYFESTGTNRIIPKVVVYTPVAEGADIYYLGFGDIQEDGSVDDKAISNNQDIEKIMATVIQTILHFLETYPQKSVFFEGSTEARIRLYQIIISREYQSISKRFSIQGLTESGFEEYQKNKNYDGFLIKLLLL